MQHAYNGYSAIYFVYSQLTEQFGHMLSDTMYGTAAKNKRECHHNN